MKKIFALIAALLCSCSNDSVDALGAINGVVKDRATGKEIAEARVECQSLKIDTKEEVITNSKGEFSFQNLEEATYIITVKANAYNEYKDTIELKQSWQTRIINLDPKLIVKNESSYAVYNMKWSGHLFGSPLLPSAKDTQSVSMDKGYLRFKLPIGIEVTMQEEIDLKANSYVIELTDETMVVTAKDKHIFTIRDLVNSAEFTDERDANKYKLIYLDNGAIWFAQDLKWNKSAYAWDEAKSACPDGWQLPDDSDWKKLGDYMKEETMLGEEFAKISRNNWWSAYEGTNGYASYWSMNYENEGLSNGLAEKNRLYFVRCMKNPALQVLNANS
ncbi:MAG: carboxypeptidase regulatory-like domain-containing protein [Fibromonadales bacterium]|nr:carboxypeptidase regulatory-like domain-containing protein [Fibromonadales bacterium]